MFLFYKQPWANNFSVVKRMFKKNITTIFSDTEKTDILNRKCKVKLLHKHDMTYIT